MSPAAAQGFIASFHTKLFTLRSQPEEYLIFLFDNFSKELTFELKQFFTFKLEMESFLLTITFVAFCH